MRHIILAILLCLTQFLPAQLNGKYIFRHIDQTDGLLHTTVKGISQDANGYMWILTWNGLQRYDGSRFVNYPEIINHFTFGTFHDSELHADTLGNSIWVFTSDKIKKLDLATSSISTITLHDFLQEKLHQPADLYTKENKEKWLIGESGAIAFDTNSKLISEFFNVNPGQHNRNTVIIKDSLSGDLLTHNFNHFMIADHKTHQIYSSSDSLPKHPLLRQLWKLYGNSNKLRYILMDSDHNLWISTWTQWLYRYNMETNVLTTYSLKDIVKQETGIDNSNNTLLVNAMYEDRQKNLWLATDYAGLLKYDRQKDNFNYITSDEKLSNGLRYTYSIISIFQDRDDNIWLGTDRGISIFNPYQNYFQSIHHIDGDNASLPKYDINDVIETDQGEILVATWGGGITIYDQQWNFIRNFHFPDPPELDLVWSFVRLEDGTIWAGTQNGYIHQYDPVQKSFKTIHPRETGNSTIATMARDPHGNILLGLFNGKIVLWNKTENTFYAFNDNASVANIPYASVIDILPDHSGKCWVTAATGLLRFDIEKRAYTHLFQPDSLLAHSGVTLQGIAPLNDSTLLIGSIYHGLYLFNMKRGVFSRPPIDDHFYTTSVYAIQKDLHGHIWLTTNFNIVKINPDFSQFTRFNIDQSIINASFGTSRFYKLNDGRWVTYTPAELICFDPRTIGMDTAKHLRVEICGFSVFDKKLQVDSFMIHHTPIVLPYNKNFVSIEFSALTYTDLRQINYYYRLTGVDQKWIHTTTKQFADYTDLHPGQYLFEVKADYGNGASPITSLAFVVNPPWWGTWWFRLACLLTLGILIYWIVRSRIHAIRKEAALQHRIAETEMMALRSQMNPHFIFNCINSIDAMIQRNDKYKATVYLNKFARLIRNVLDSSKQNKIPLSKDMETLQLYIDLELFRHYDKFTATVTAEEELLQNDYKVPPLIVQPYVENAILHGLRHKMDHPGKLSVTVTRQDECIMYVIEDNGVGRNSVKNDLRKGSNGYGMQISSDRVRLFNKEEIASVQIIDLETNGVPAGTRVEVQLKIQ